MLERFSHWPLQKICLNLRFLGGLPMRKMCSLDERQKMFNEKFESVGITLKTYIGMHKSCTVHCEIHGDQEVSTFNHAFKSKYGCPQCGMLKRGVNGKPSEDEYLKIFHEIHGEKYTYEMTRDDRYRITLFCPEHGASKVMPSYVAKGAGCPKCGVKARAGRPKKST